MLYLTSSVANRGSHINAIAVSVSIDFEYIKRKDRTNLIVNYLMCSVPFKNVFMICQLLQCFIFKICICFFHNNG